MNEHNNHQENNIELLLTFSRGAKSRKKVLKALISRPKNCNQIRREVKLEWWTVQKHLQILMKANLIKHVDLGNIKFYKLTKNAKEMVDSLIL